MGVERLRARDTHGVEGVEADEELMIFTQYLSVYVQLQYVCSPTCQPPLIFWVKIPYSYLIPYPTAARPKVAMESRKHADWCT